MSLSFLLLEKIKFEAKLAKKEILLFQLYSRSQAENFKSGLLWAGVLKKIGKEMQAG